MEFVHNFDSLVVTVKFENKKHIKHCYLRVINNDLIHIRANINFTYEDVLDLLEKKKKWLIKRLNQTNKIILNEDEFLYFGEKKKIEDYNIKDIDKFYRETIEKTIPSIVEKYSKLMKLYPSLIKYRKNKRTWGSCNYKNALSFNTQLCKFPIEIMEYVVVHELAHIKHKNHSKKFWNLVELYCPDYKKTEELFKTLL